MPRNTNASKNTVYLAFLWSMLCPQGQNTIRIVWQSFYPVHGHHIFLAAEAGVDKQLLEKKYWPIYEAIYQNKGLDLQLILRENQVADPLDQTTSGSRSHAGPRSEQPSRFAEQSCPAEATATLTSRADYLYDGTADGHSSQVERSRTTSADRINQVKQRSSASEHSSPGDAAATGTSSSDNLHNDRSNYDSSLSDPDCDPSESLISDNDGPISSKLSSRNTVLKVI